jgi:hypothetical protein
MLNTPIITFTPNEVSTGHAARVSHLKQSRAAEWRGVCSNHHDEHDDLLGEPAPQEDRR